MTTRFDDEADDPELAPDDPLAVILAPPSDYLAPPPGSYDTIRRRANRRRLVRTAIGAGATCAARRTHPAAAGRPAAGRGVAGGGWGE
ncbi:hypothetical protein L0P92_31855, partial [Streptomyces muensis]|nr:hypothetical protein [Streptomyces muensis]